MLILTGLIAFWSGSIASIPSGWLLCDGNNGTPDLRDLFPIAAGTGGTLSPGDTGGNINHNHDFTGDDHLHNITGGIKLATGLGFSDQTDTDQGTGTTDNTDARPPYVALLPIMIA